MSRNAARTAGALAAGIALAVALAGCSASSDAQDTAIGRAQVADAGAPAPEAMAPDAAGTADEATVSAGAPAQVGAPTQQQVVRTAYLSMQADNVSKAAFSIHGLVAKVGGSIANEQTQATGDGTSSMITARVPAARLDTFMTDVSALGSVDSTSITADDVTSSVVDLDARINALQTSIERMTQLLANAKQIDDLLAIETQLSSRQSDLDALTAQRRYLADQVAMSAVTISVSPTAALAPVDAPGFLSGLQNGWTAFVSVITVAITALGFVLPFLLIAALVLVPLGYVGARHARRTRQMAAGFGDAQDESHPERLDDRAPTTSPT